MADTKDLYTKRKMDSILSNKTYSNITNGVLSCCNF